MNLDKTFKSDIIMVCIGLNIGLLDDPLVKIKGDTGAMGF